MTAPAPLPPPNRPATKPASGATRDGLLTLLATAIGSAASAYVLSQTGNPQLAGGAGALSTAVSMGVMTWVRKSAMDFFVSWAQKQVPGA